MRNLLLIIKEDFLNLLKNPMWIFYATGFPILIIVIMGYLTRQSYGNEVTSYDYYGISMMIYTLLNSGMTSANAFLEERIKKPNMRIIYAPGSVKNIYLSKIIASFLFGYIFHVIDFLFLHALFHIYVRNWVYLFVLFAAIELFAAAFGIMLCCVVKSESMTNQIQGIIVNIFAILGGVLFSLDGYGKTVEHISMISPVRWMVKMAFQVVYDNDFHLFGPVVLCLLLAICLLLIICNVTFRREDCIC